LANAPKYLMPLVALVATACSTANGGTPAVLVKPLSQGVVNGELGDMLNANAKMKAAEAEYKALETGETGMAVEWRVSDKLFGKVVPQQPFRVGKTDCRRYVHTVSNRGDIRSAAGTACRDADGVWQPVS
jgi:surface antigen